MAASAQDSHIQRPVVVVVVADDVSGGSAFVAGSERDALLGEVASRLFLGVGGVIGSDSFDVSLPISLVFGSSNLDPLPASGDAAALKGAVGDPGSSNRPGADWAGLLGDELGGDDASSGAVPLGISGVVVTLEVHSALGTPQNWHASILTGRLKKRE